MFAACAGAPARLTTRPQAAKMTKAASAADRAQRKGLNIDITPAATRLPDGPMAFARNRARRPAKLSCEKSNNSSLSQFFPRRAELITDSRVLGLVTPLAALHHFRKPIG